MIVPLSIALVIALISFCISVNATDEIVKLAAAFITLLCLFFSLVFAPMLVKLLMVVALLLSEKYAKNIAACYWSIYTTINK
jgi:hypothetical protein